MATGASVVHVCRCIPVSVRKPGQSRGHPIRVLLKASKRLSDIERQRYPGQGIDEALDDASVSRRKTALDRQLAAAHVSPVTRRSMSRNGPPREQRDRNSTN
jgi:hypothetical protein